MLTCAQRTESLSCFKHKAELLVWQRLPSWLIYGLPLCAIWFANLLKLGMSLLSDLSLSLHSNTPSLCIQYTSVNKDNAHVFQLTITLLFGV